MDEIKARSNGHSSLVADVVGPTLEEFDLDRLRQQAIEAGVDTSQMGHQRQIADRRARAMELARQANTSRLRHWHEQMRGAVATVADFLVLAVTLFAKYLMPPVGIVGLWWVEIERTQTGIALFDAPRAGTMSCVLLSVYLSMLVVRSNLAAQAGETETYRWSLRAAANSLLYLAGFQRLRQKTRLQAIDSVIRGLVVLVVMLGTSGTLAEELVVYQGAWYDALYNIATQSDLITMLTLVSGALVSYLLLVALEYVVQMTYAQYAQIMPEDATGADFFAAYSDAQQSADRAEALYLMAQIQKASARQNQS